LKIGFFPQLTCTASFGEKSGLAVSINGVVLFDEDAVAEAVKAIADAKPAAEQSATEQAAKEEPLGDQPAVPPEPKMSASTSIAVA
jgi:hypothetical protein